MDRQPPPPTTPPATPHVPATPTTPDSITEGSVTVGGQAIAYKAIAGTLTVGGSDPQDATIGFDGKPLPDSNIKLPEKIEDAPPTPRMFYVAYLRKTPLPRSAPSPSSTTAAPAHPP